FILALGYKAEKIKDYFINYDERVSNDFVYTLGGNRIEMLNTDIDDWKITFVDTGMKSNVGMRLMRLRKLLEGEEMFLANYADGLSDIHLPEVIHQFKSQPDKVASLVSYRPTGSFHLVESNNSGLITSIAPIANTKLSLNVGYFCLRPEIFDYMNYGEELVEAPLQRLIDEKKLITYQHDGFWQSMDTFKDKMLLDDMNNAGSPPWEVWNQDRNDSWRQRDEETDSNPAL
ncbi:MAG: glucose-1-phosphate cytidylyltransferase, partial [Bacteroidota bacterium]